MWKSPPSNFFTNTQWLACVLWVPLVSYEGFKLPVPLPGHLVQSVKTLLQLAYQVLLALSNKFLWLVHVYLLFKIIMQECCLDNQLLDFKVHAFCYAQQCPDWCHLDHLGENLVEIHSFLRLETLHHDPAFIPWWISAISRFQLVHPLILEHLLSFWQLR